MDRYDRERFSGLLDEIARSAQAYARFMAWRVNDAEDIFQTALLNAYKKFGDFREGSNFRAWIFKFIIHAAYNVNRRTSTIGKTEILHENEETMPTPAIEVLNNEYAYEEVLSEPEKILNQIAPEMKLSIATLPEKRRNIFLLRSIADLSYAEIANVLRIPIGTVMGELSRARKNLREQLCSYAKDKRILRREVSS